MGRPNQGQNLLHGFESQKIQNIYKKYKISSTNTKTCQNILNIEEKYKTFNFREDDYDFL